MAYLINPWPFASAEPAWSGAPGFIGNGNPATATTHVAINVPYPADVKFHDILILAAASIEGSSGTPSIITPTGFTLLNAANINSSFFQNAIFWKRALGNETGTVSVGLSGGAGDGFIGIMANFRGCLATGTPYEAKGSTVGASSSPTGASVTTTGADRLVVNMIAKQTTGSATSTAGPGYTERYDRALSGSTGAALVLDTRVQSTAGVVAADATTSSASTNWRCVSFALLPR